MSTTIPEITDLRGSALFWHVMDILKGLPPVAPGACGTGWDQDQWRRIRQSDDRCGTAMCLAGWMCHVTGGRWLVTYDTSGKRFLNGKPCDKPLEAYEEYLLVEHFDEKGGQHVIKMDGHDDVRVISAADRALTLLGVDSVDTDSGWLFSGGNDYEDLEWIGRILFGARPAA
ncbi:hypothetical protein ACQPYK_25070 [Streptosporangium sp. CA-135522]|uniref:hypothetical protein n=1 Tax=Streptosporangium sp. CA-135522 TaxID=3240072 RepID=UPI003D90914C